MNERNDRGPARILIVDDDDVDRETLRRMIAALPLDVEIEEAVSGIAALEVVNAEPFDCILLDYHLSDGVGTDFVALFNEKEEVACPIILVTGMGNEMVAVKAMREGVYDYLSKHNLDTEQLQNTIESCLRRVQLEKELKHSQDRLRWLGLYDSLTGLPNRNLFFDRLEQAVHAVDRSNTGFALLMIDLDLFKEVNDSFGHGAGDQVLAEIGRRLQKAARVSDTYARIGGDEFVAILMGTHTVEGACVVADSLCAAIKQPIHLGDTLVTVGASIGVALAPLHSKSGRELLAQADLAMYSAKQSSRGYEVARGGPTELAEVSSIVVASQIAEAINRRELVLFFQPKVSLKSGELAGVEALLRWNKPGDGLISPNRFIPAIERTATIAPVTYLVLDLALDQMRRWRDQGWNVPVSINLSARMLDDPALAQRIASDVAARDLPAEQLTLEITETSLMSDPVGAKRVLAALSEAGFAISIDDFGTGYTSFLHLKELDIHEIKLDKAFIDGLASQGRDESIVRSVAMLSKGFKIDLVAEGIESRDRVPLLKQLGCTLGQGYSIARPMPADEIVSWWAIWQSSEQRAFAA